MDIIYPIQLAGPNKKINIASIRVLAQARSEAETLAKALGIPLFDRSGSEEIVREADYLDESLRERRRRTGESLGNLPPAPEGMKTQLRTEDQEIVLENPRARFTPGALKCFFPSVVLCGIIAIVFGGPLIRDLEKGDYFFISILSAFLLLPTICFSIFLFVLQIGLSYTVRVSPERLRLTTRVVIFCRTAEIRADELEELLIVKPGSSDGSWENADIVARSDRRTLRIGPQLPLKEKEWIKSVLDHVLTL